MHKCFCHVESVINILLAHLALQLVVPQSVKMCWGDCRHLRDLLRFHLARETFKLDVINIESYRCISCCRANLQLYKLHKISILIAQYLDMDLYFFFIIITRLLKGNWMRKVGFLSKLFHHALTLNNKLQLLINSSHIHSKFNGNCIRNRVNLK